MPRLKTRDRIIITLAVVAMAWAGTGVPVFDLLAWPVLIPVAFFWILLSHSTRSPD